MTTVSASTLINTSYNVVGDTTGTLVFQTGATPTTALSISASQVVTFATDAIIHGLTVGQGAGSVSTNTAVGSGSLNENTTGSQNTAVGYQAGYTITTGTNNTALGASIMDQSAGVTGTENTAIGRINMRGLTSGSYNTAVGNVGLNGLTSGSYNTAVGYSALFSNTSANYNTAVGYQAGYNVNGSAYSVFIGSRTASAGASVITGTYHTCVGDAAGFLMQGASINNTLIGQSAGSNITTGSYNTVLGSYNGNQGGLNITTSSNYIVLSDGAGNPRGYFNGNGTFYITNASYEAHVFYRQASTASTAIGEWDSDNHGTDTTCAYFRADGGLANYSANNTNLSDQRVKKDIALAGNYLAKICSIPVKNFRYASESEADPLTLGVIAQDVQAIAPELISTEGFGNTKAPDGSELLTVYQTDLQYALMKCIQELNSTITDLQSKLKAAGVAGF
jgi:hypothetical protein